MGRRSQDFTSVPYFYKSPLKIQKPPPRCDLLSLLSFNAPSVVRSSPPFSLNGPSEVRSSPLLSFLCPLLCAFILPCSPSNSPPHCPFSLPTSVPIKKQHKHQLSTTSRNTHHPRPLPFQTSSASSLLLHPRCDDTILHRSTALTTSPPSQHPPPSHLTHLTHSKHHHFYPGL